MEASNALASSPDDTAPQSAVSLLDLELVDALPPPDAPSMPPPAWVLDGEREPLLEEDDPVVPTPWRPQRGAFATAFMVHACFFLIALAGARTAYAHFGAEPSVAPSVTHRKSAAADRVPVSRDLAHKTPKGRSAPLKK